MCITVFKICPNMLRTFKNQKMKLLCHLRLIMLAHLVVSIDSVCKIAVFIFRERDRDEGGRYREIKNRNKQIPKLLV